MKRANLIFPVLIALTGCMAPDSFVPDFARLPYEPMTRETVVAIAMREWRLFGSPVESDTGAVAPADGLKLERQPGLWQRVGEYWWLGLDAGQDERRWTGMHDEHGRVFPPARDEHFAWSAAFVSYVMRIAGAGRRFPYSLRHSDYIDAARKASLAGDRSALLWAESPDAAAPQRGDLICFPRGTAATLRFEDLPAPPFPAHCAIVVGIEPNRLAVIGGNVDDAVTMTHVPVTTEGRLAAPMGPVLDSRYPWFVVIRVRYDR